MWTCKYDHGYKLAYVKFGFTEIILNELFLFFYFLLCKWTFYLSETRKQEDNITDVNKEKSYNMYFMSV